MDHPTTRVLAVLELLQAHGRMSGAELARRLRVDPRTVRRYIALLEEMGIPITAERGRHGAYLLVAGFKLPPMMFTDDEALALSVGLLAARGLGLGEAGPAVASAQAKLERVMPTNLKRRLRAVDETVELDLSRRASPANAAALAVLSEAAQASRRVHLRYRAATGAADSTKGEPSERDFDPYGLAYRGGCWYAVGWCHLRQGLRSFRLDRIVAVRAQAASFTRPPGFDTLGHLAFAFATLPRRHKVEVLLRTDLRTAQRELYPSIGVLEPLGDGVLLRGQCDELPWFARELARLPFAFEIRRPPELRAALRGRAAELAALAKA
jgi:predicted DNA-binding transcriptional regulator YafY